MTETTAKRSNLRWWVLGAIFVAAIASRAIIDRLPIQDELMRGWWSLMSTFIAAGLLLLWVLFFAKLSWALRICLLVIGAGAFFAAHLFLAPKTVNRMASAKWVGNFTPDPTPEEDTSQPDYSLPELKPVDGANLAAVDLKTTTPLDYPRFLGVDGRGTVTGEELAADWTAATPKQLWRQPIGAGLSAFSIVGDFAVTQEQRGSLELVSCYELKTGKVRWVHQDKTRFSESQGGDGPRATPTIYDGNVYAMGATGILNCLDGATGKVIWSHNILTEHQENNLNWGKSCSPLVFDNLVVVGLGDSPRPSLAAYNRLTGEQVWQSGHDTTTYASPVLATIAGVRQIIVSNSNAVSGNDPADGHILWQFGWQNAIKCSNPRPLPNDRIFLSCEYGVGCSLIEIKPSAIGLAPTEIWKNPHMQTKFSNIVYRDGFIYGLDSGILECLDAATGKLKWKGDRYGTGQVMLVNDDIVVMGDDGTLALVKASPEKSATLASFEALKGRTWNNPAISGRYLLVRNTTEAACYELALKPDKSAATQPTTNPSATAMR